VGVAGYIGVVLLLIALAIGAYALRRFRLLRAGGVHVALRRRIDESSPRGWHLGVGRYQGDEFVWYRVLSVRSGPSQVIPRVGLEIADRRAPSTPESYSMPQDATVLLCQSRFGELELAMDHDALTGFLSWLESSPPGHAVPWMS
jgi:hypothetical protein